MTFHDIARLIAKFEGKKKPISIAQIKEVLKIVRTLIQNDPLIMAYLIKPSDPKAKRR